MLKASRKRQVADNRTLFRLPAQLSTQTRDLEADNSLRSWPQIGHWRPSGHFLQLAARNEREPRVKGEVSGYTAYPNRSHPVAAQTKITLTESRHTLDLPRGVRRAGLDDPHRRVVTGPHR